MRQFGEVPPWLSAAAAPAVVSMTGIGAGGGAGVQTQDGQGFGEVCIVTGSNPAAGGSVTLNFPQLPPILFFTGSDVFGVISAAGNDGAHNQIVLSWTAQLPPGARCQLHYEWAVSR
jgi:hypothetical protein